MNDNSAGLHTGFNLNNDYTNFVSREFNGYETQQNLDRQPTSHYSGDIPVGHPRRGISNSQHERQTRTPRTGKYLKPRLLGLGRICGILFPLTNTFKKKLILTAEKKAPRREKDGGCSLFEVRQLKTGDKEYSKRLISLKREEFLNVNNETELYNALIAEYIEFLEQT